MYQSYLFTKTTKTVPAEEKSINAQLLIKAGFVDKLMSGVWTYLPLGLRVLEKIKNIIRQELSASSAQEILMPALHPAAPWQKTNRWPTEAMYHLKEDAFGLGWTHEEIITPLVQKFVHSYKDLPLAVYQIQDKFRNEPRPRSGLLRGREFSMKDLYSFHTDEKNLNNYYEKIKKVYFKIFNRCGLKTELTEATGGAFSPYSHEFQVITPQGEDTIYYCTNCKKYRNKELPKCHERVKEFRGIEVGNIFKLGTRFSQAFNFRYTDQKGKTHFVYMGCYGIGPSRIMGAVVEIHHDQEGIIWPKEIAPFQVHLVALKPSEQKIYSSLQKNGFSVLYDDRNLPPAVKLKDADLIGLPVRIIISKKTKNKLEVKERDKKTVKLLSLVHVQKYLQTIFPGARH